jgi:hypothetical protein
LAKPIEDELNCYYIGKDVGELEGIKCLADSFGN